MKKILKKQREVADLWSDASGKKFPHGIPPVEVKISFSYGSQYDESDLCFHFTDKEVKPLLVAIKTVLCKKSIKELQLKQKDKDGNNSELISLLIKD